MAFQLQKQTSLSLIILDEDIEPFINGLKTLADNLNTPGFKQGKKREMAELFLNLYEEFKIPTQIINEQDNE